MDKEACLGTSSIFQASTFCDSRLFSTCNKLLERIVSSGHLIIKNLAGGRAEQIQFERFLWNPRVQVQMMLESAKEHVASRAEHVEHVLAIQDSSELNFNHRKHEIRGLGVVKNEAVGLFVHPVIAVDLSDTFVLGMCSCQMWSWQANRVQKSQHDIDEQNLEEKESFRWVQSALEAKKVLRKAKMTTFVSDRESDIYPLFCRVPDEKTHILVRSKADRYVVPTEGAGKKQKLTSFLSQVPFVGTREVPIRERSVVKSQNKLSIQQRFGKSANGRGKRTALLSIKYAEVTVVRPRAQSHSECPSECRLTCVEVVETNASSESKSEDKIHWRLLTTHHCDSEEKAWEIVDWYRKRWHIEQLFRTAKKGGYGLEKIDCVKSESIEKLSLLGLFASVKTLQLTLCRDGEINRPIEEIFTEKESRILSKLNTKYEGKTLKQKNPYQPKTVAWSYWIVGRLGGWKGYSSEGPAGPITIKSGLEKLRSFVEAFTFFEDVCIT